MSLVDGVSLIDAGAASLIAEAVSALSAPSRVQILGCLLSGPLAVGDISVQLGMEQSAVSHQLRVLREAGLVSAERHGKRRVYAISGDVVQELLTAARHLAGAAVAREKYTCNLCARPPGGTAVSRTCAWALPSSTACGSPASRYYDYYGNYGARCPGLVSASAARAAAVVAAVLRSSEKTPPG